MPKAKKTQKKQSTPYLRRALEDERIHGHVADASERLRKAYYRAARQPKGKAAEDQQIYEYVRQAVASLSAAGRILRRQPQRKPKRRAPTLILLAGLAGAGVLLAKRASRGSEHRDQFDRPAEPVEPARHDHTTEQAPAAGPNNPS
jgi:hypothetical protein